jgi:putative zinc finger/helix-turn-helix YgiT family protein
MNCPNCKRKMSSKRLRSYEAGELLGMRSVLVRNLAALVCPKCKHVVLDGALLDSLHEHLLLDILSNGHVLGGEEVRFIRKALGLSQAALADRLGVHRVSVARWESGEVPADGPTSVAIRALAAIQLVSRPAKTKETTKETQRIKDSFDRPLAPPTAPGRYTLDATG